MTKARWGALLILALAVGGWSGRVVGAPPGGVVAQSGGTSSSGSGSSSGSSGSGDSGSSSGSGDSGSSGSGDSGSSGGGTGDDGTGGTGGTGGDGSAPTAGGEGSGGTATTAAGDGEPAATTAPPDVPEEAIADAEETDCDGGAAGQRCYEVEQVDGVEAVRVPDGKGGTVVVALGDAPQVNIDSGASTSASSNVDLRVDVDVNTGDVIRVERRVDPGRQLLFVTLAALLGVFVGAAVLGTFFRFRNGPRPR